MFSIHRILLVYFIALACNAADLLAAPATLEEVVNSSNWVDQPVKSSLDYLKEAQAQHALRPMGETERPHVTEDEVDWDASLVLNKDVGLRVLNPVFEESIDSMRLNRLINLYLADFDNSGQIKGNGDAIVSWQSSEDHSMDKIVIRDDLDWSDGKPFTAADVEFTFKVLTHPEVPVPMMTEIVRGVSEVKAYGPKTVVFFHKKKLASNRNSLWIHFLPKHIYETILAKNPRFDEDEANAYENGDKPFVSCGPYKVKKHQPGQTTELERRDEWSLRKVDGKLKRVRLQPYHKTIRFKHVDDKIEYMLFEGGETDIQYLSTDKYDRAQHDPKYKRGDKQHKYHLVKSRDTGGFSYIGWNLNTPFFSDLKIRQAMAYAFDYEEALTKLARGLNYPAAGIYPNSYYRGKKSTAKPYKQDLEKAADILEAAGWKFNNSNVREKVINGKIVKFDFSILTSQNQANIDLAQMFSNNLGAIGVRATVKPLDASTMFQAVNEKRFTAFFAGWSWDPSFETDASMFRRPTDQGGNPFGYDSTIVSDLFERVRHESDLEKQQELFGQINDQIAKDQPIMMVWHPSARYALQKHISGLRFWAGQPYTYNPGVLSIWTKKKKQVVKRN